MKMTQHSGNRNPPWFGRRRERILKPHIRPQKKGAMFGHFCSDLAPSASLRTVVHSLATHGGARLRLFKHLGAQVFGGEIGLILPRDGVQNR